MMNKSIKNIIDLRLENICVNENLEKKILNTVKVPKRKIRWSLVAAAMCLCLTLTLPVLAATVSSFSSLLSKVGLEIGEQLKPINLVCEDDGIKMEVVAAMNDDDAAFIYLTLQDLTEDNRIDESIDLFRYYIKCDKEYIPASSETIAYDDARKIATIKLSSNAAGAGINTFKDKKLTVYVDSFISNKQEFDDFDTGINLANMDDKVNTISLDIMGLSKGSSSPTLLSELEEQKIIDILNPNELNIPLSGIDFACISNLGIVDGRLHVQLRRNQNTKGMNISGYIALIADSLDAVKNNEYFTVDWDNYIHLPRVEINFHTDENNKIEYDNLYIENYEEGETYIEYIEIIFDANPDIISNCKLMALGFSAYRNYTHCNLQATFELEPLKESISSICDIDLDGIKLNNITVSPLGVVLFGNDDKSYNVNIDITLTMTDGSVMKLGESIISKIANEGNTIQSFTSLSQNPNVFTSTNSGENGEFNIKYNCNIPLDIEKVASVTINDNIVVLE